MAVKNVLWCAHCKKIGRKLGRALMCTHCGGPLVSVTAPEADELVRKHAREKRAKEGR